MSVVTDLAINVTCFHCRRRFIYIKDACIGLKFLVQTRGVSEIKRRLREKVDQALQGDSNLPTLACVVGFRAKLIVMQTVESEL